MRRVTSAAVAGLAAAALTATGALSAPTAGAAPSPSGDSRPSHDSPLDSPQDSARDVSGLLGNGLDEANQHIDRREGRRAPSAPQRTEARRSAIDVRWNQYGTPSSLSPDRAEAVPRTAGPEAAARGYLRRTTGLFGLDRGAVADLETLAVVPVGDGAVVTMRQRIGGLPAAQGGLVTVAVRDGAVIHVSSSLTPDATRNAGAVALDAGQAREQAIEAADLESASADVLRTRRVAVPTPTDGTRTAYEVVLAETGGEGAAYTVLIDAANGELLVRESIVDHLEDNPTWTLFGSTPPDEQSTERDVWCWLTVAGCDDAVDTGASPLAWDVDPATEAPTDTTEGNNAVAGEAWDLQPFLPMINRTAQQREDRDYDYDFDNVWRTNRCDPEVLEGDGNDIDAAAASLFAHHNRLHDFAYHLGFTEETWNAQQDNFGKGGRAGDPEIGKAQSGAQLGYRDNANQYTPPDGIAPWSNMYLWQPIAGGAYPPCVDGDFDGTVIGHEYTHMITNRMVAGPDSGLSGYQAGGMGESWSDLMAMEYLFELGKRPKGDTPYVTGAYVTGDDRQGIRNYDMSDSPLNYSDIGYDVVGLSVHSEGEIWSATNVTVRDALIERYGEGDAEQQRACADGDTPVEECPGNRRWAQLVIDSLLIPATGSVSMVDMRDAMLVADQLRFGGANQDLLWDAFARRGLGEHASSQGPDDTDPVADFSSPYADNAEVRFRTVGRTSEPVRFYVGDYEKEAMPVADSDPATERDARVAMTPGRYRGLAVGPSIGHHRFEFEVKPNQRRTIPVRVSENVAAAANGATAAGDGSDLGALLDGTEATAWNARTDVPEEIAGVGVTVDLAGERPHRVGRVEVSAFFESASRFSALRQFAVLACDASTGADCEDPDAFDRVYLSPPDAFPGDGFRPTAPDLLARSFTIPSTKATHLRMEVVSNQCTGGPDFRGDLDDDPGNVTDCPTGAPDVASEVHAAEFQAFRR